MRFSEEQETSVSQVVRNREDKRGHDGHKLGSSEIWSDKLKVLYNRHTEGRRYGGNAMLRRCRRHKERRRCSVQILDNYFGINALYINC